MIRMYRALLIGCVALGVSLGNLMGCHDKPPRLAPTQMAALGDSITRGFDSWFPLENPPLSWSTGFHSPAEIGLGVPYILSHSQRIQLIHGSAGHSAVNHAVVGKGWSHGDDQAALVAPTTTYVTVLLGANDVCRNDGDGDGDYDVDDIPSASSIRDRLIDTLDVLETRLPDGATIQVVGIPDIKAFRDIAINEKGPLGIDCQALWDLQFPNVPPWIEGVEFPCGTMLHSSTTEASRLAVQQRNFEYNDEIADEVYTRNLNSERLYYHFADLENVPIDADDISDLDCFHPSWEGEALISHVVWEQGPFSP